MKYVYIAGKFTSKDRLRVIRERFQGAGFEVCSSWLDEPETDYSASIPYKIECAERDFADISRADILIVDTVDVSDTGGREVEVGFALAMGLGVAVVGPARNVFHYLLPIFETWEEALTWATA